MLLISVITVSHPLIQTEATVYHPLSGDEFTGIS